MGVLAWVRNFCLLGLVITVGLGAYLIDRRFTSASRARQSANRKPTGRRRARFGAVAVVGVVEPGLSEE